MYYQGAAKIGLLLGLAVLIVGIIARRSYRSQGRMLAAAHASWQVNTVWIAAALFVALIVVLFAIFAWMGQDPNIQAQLDAITKSDASPLDQLRALWNVRGIKAVVGACLIVTLLSIIWPLKRVFQGVLTLRSGREPSNAGGTGFVSLLLAVVVQVALMVLFVMLY